MATLLSYIALNMISSSVWQISRGGNIITTAILSKLLLKRKFNKTAVIGCVMAFLGITSVQLV
jgi:drug/metabolite transporter (DMT)-like permease